MESAISQNASKVKIIQTGNPIEYGKSQDSMLVLLIIELPVTIAKHYIIFALGMDVSMP